MCNEIDQDHPEQVNTTTQAPSDAVLPPPSPPLQADSNALTSPIHSLKMIPENDPPSQILDATESEISSEIQDTQNSTNTAPAEASPQTNTETSNNQPSKSESDSEPSDNKPEGSQSNHASENKPSGIVPSAESGNLTVAKFSQPFNAYLGI